MDDKSTSALSLWSAFYFCELAGFQVSSTIRVYGAGAKCCSFPNQWGKKRLRLKKHPDSTVLVSPVLYWLSCPCIVSSQAIYSIQHYSTDQLCSWPPLVFHSICPFPFLPLSRGCSARSHDPKERVDVVALDGVSTGRDHLVLGLTHWGGGGTATQRLTWGGKTGTQDITHNKLTHTCLSSCSMPFDRLISINLSVFCS